MKNKPNLLIDPLYTTQWLFSYIPILFGIKRINRVDYIPKSYFSKDRYDGIELNFHTSMIFLEDWKINYKRLEKILKKDINIYGIHTLHEHHLPYFRKWEFNLSTEDRESIEIKTKAQMEAIKFIKRNTPNDIFVVIHPGCFYNKEDREKALKKSLENGKIFIEKLLKIDGIIPVIENMPKSYSNKFFLGSENIEELLPFIELDERVKMVFDMGHAITNEAYSKDYTDRMIELYGKNITYMHIHYNPSIEIDFFKVKHPQKSLDKHLPLTRIPEYLISWFKDKMFKLFENTSLLQGAIQFEIPRERILLIVKVHKNGSTKEEHINSVKLVRKWIDEFTSIKKKRKNIS